MEITEFLKNTAAKNGFSRDRYTERNVPTDYDNIVVMTFFGDLKSVAIISSILLKRYRESRKDKYFILVSWPGCQSLFPYVDEYWSPSNHSQIKSFYEQSSQFSNKSDLLVNYSRSLNESFRDVINQQVLSAFYENGITQKFWDQFEYVQRFFPQIPSPAALGKDINRELASRSGDKVFVTPCYFARTWLNGRSKNISIPKDFWVGLIKNLLTNGYMPVVWDSFFSYDLSSELTDQCIFFQEGDVWKALGMMRATGCVVDIFSGMSGLSMIARCPFICVIERSLFNHSKENEIDDLCAFDSPRQYIFSFATPLGDRQSWEMLYSSIVKKLNVFLPELDRNAWPNPAEIDEVVPNSVVTKKRNKKMGVRFLKIKHD